MFLDSFADALEKEKSAQLYSNSEDEVAALEKKRQKRSHPASLLLAKNKLNLNSIFDEIKTKKQAFQKTGESRQSSQQIVATSSSVTKQTDYGTSAVLISEKEKNIDSSNDDDEDSTEDEIEYYDEESVDEDDDHINKDSAMDMLQSHEMVDEHLNKGNEDHPQVFKTVLDTPTILSDCSLPQNQVLLASDNSDKIISALKEHIDTRFNEFKSEMRNMVAQMMCDMPLANNSTINPIINNDKTLKDTILAKLPFKTMDALKAFEFELHDSEVADIMVR